MEYNTLNSYDIGFHPETNQAYWGNRFTSPFGNAIRGGFKPLSGANYDWFLFEPYYWPTDFYGQQMVGVPPSEFLYGNYLGYRGVLPLSLQSVSPEPYPYELDYPYNMVP